ncbi:hypothetical protein ACC811_02315 [Rhizobium ruizarguesonis]
MQDNKDETAVPDAPQIKADTWFALAIAAFVITLVIFISVAIWIFTGDPRQIQPLAQAFTPFGGALIAVVTFFTIAWRGVLNTKQLEYQAAQIGHQAEQLSQTRRQNDAKDDENLAKLLMDGTKLLGDPKESHVLAGVAALQAVVTSPRGAFASQAMDILVDLVEATYNDSAKNKVFGAAREAVNLGAKTGRMSTRTLLLTYDPKDKPWVQAINGVTMLIYQNATIEDMEYAQFSDFRAVRFENCVMEGVKVDGNHRSFKGCDMQSCKIMTMTSTFLIRNQFDGCDFSGASFTGSRPPWKKGTPYPLERLLGRGNWFEEENPITGGESIKWDAFIEKIATVEFEGFEDDDVEVV